METLRQWLERGPFGLAMSSGFFGFFAHTGVLSVLEGEGLIPHRLAGSSAGALVATAYGSGLDTPELVDVLRSLRRQHFWDPAPGLGLLRGRRMRERLETMLEGRRFEDCRIPTAVSAYDVWARRAQLLDEGPMAPAVQASCAVPGMFHPVWIGGRPYVDGGVEDRAGLLGIDEGRVLYHHLGSRVPWPAVPLPPRPGVVALVLHGLPRPGPFRLEEGIRAYEAAQRATRKALDRPVLGGVALEHASGSSA